MDTQGLGKEAAAWIEQTISVSVAAKIIGKSIDHTNALVVAGTLVGKKIGHNWAVFKPSVEVYRAAHSRVLKTRRQTP